MYLSASFGDNLPKGSLALQIATLLILWLGPAASLSARTVAVLGDSISTGAVAHRDIGFDEGRLTDIIEGRNPLSPSSEAVAIVRDAGFSDAADFIRPTRLWFSMREYSGGFQWLGKHLLGAFSSSYLDVEEFSWFYLVARQNQFNPHDIWVAAEDGARMEHAIRQMDRVLDHGGGNLPDEIWVFFTGNDLCGPTLDFVTAADDYGSSLEHLIRYILRNGSAPESGSVIRIMDLIGALQLTYSEEIQNKVVSAHGKSMTCRDLQSLPLYESHGVYKGILALLPQSPTAYCPTLLVNKTKDDQERLVQIGNRIQAFRSEIHRVVTNINQSDSQTLEKARIRLQAIESPGKMVLAADDIAEDCFHLSLKGHAKLAKMVQTELRK